MRILCLGGSGTGKSSIINRLKASDAAQTQPTRGFNVTSIEYGATKFTVWEIGGEDERSGQWKQYAQNSQGIMYVVDSNSRVANYYSDLQQILQVMTLSSPPSAERATLSGRQQQQAD